MVLEVAVEIIMAILQVILWIIKGGLVVFACSRIYEIVTCKCQADRIENLLWVIACIVLLT